MIAANRILAIAGLTLRSAVRSKIFILLAVLVLSGIACLPFVIKSDGSLVGQVRLYLHYALGLSIVLLSIIAIWTGAGAVSLELEEGHLQMLVVKPVRPWEIWLGKWLGLMIINLALLALAGASIYGLLRWHTQPALLPAQEQIKLQEELLVARADVLPLRSAAALNDEQAGLAVMPGQVGYWQFNLPAWPRPSDFIFLQFSFVSSRPDYLAPIAGLWQIEDAAGSQLGYFPVSSLADQVYSFKIPAPAAGHSLNVSYKNLEQAVRLTVLFSAADSVKLRVQATGFESNYLRALLMVLARLAFFSALGLTAGAAFSQPVAAFVALALLLITALNRWLQQTLAGGLPAYANLNVVDALLLLIERGLQAVLLVLNKIAPPLYLFDPLVYLPNGMLISWELVGKACLVLGLIYPGLLASASIWLLRRREMGLPTL